MAPGEGWAAVGVGDSEGAGRGSTAVVAVGNAAAVCVAASGMEVAVASPAGFGSVQDASSRMDKTSNIFLFMLNYSSGWRRPKIDG
jgi:hypothetical protein